MLFNSLTFVVFFALVLDRLSPRDKTWEPLIKSTGATGIYFEDHPELSGFECPEWSHLSAGDSVEFTKRLVPHLRTALQL